VRRFAAIFSVVGLLGLSAASALAKPYLWWEPRASEFWTINRAAIWRMFDNGQCTELAARKRWVLVRRIIVGQVSREVRKHQPEMLTDLQAHDWATDAQSVGVPVGTTPLAGALVVFQPGVLGAAWDGHIAYVERVYRDGSYEISEMNAPIPYQVTYRRLSAWTTRLAGVSFIYWYR
jgi:hypothetical protein